MKQKTIFTLAILVLILPFLGLPESWKTTFFVLIALFLVYIAYNQEIKSFFTPKLPTNTTVTDTFVEHIPENRDSETVI